nr:RNA-directed DNA polymerase, eukaryota [Tanacetum cinerariifolium]
MVVSFSFTVNLYHDGLFAVNLLEYVHFDSRVIDDDVSFDGMSFNGLFATIRRLVLISPTSIYYRNSGDPLTALKLLKNNEGLCEFGKACYENNLKIDLFTEHNGSDIMEIIHEDLHPKKPVSHVDSDSDVLGMRFESSQQLKHMLANYGVQHDYQLWYMQNDHNKLLAFCGRDFSQGKCAGLKGKEPKTVDDNKCDTRKQGSKKGDCRKAVNETLSKVVKEIWNKKGK